MPQYVKNDLRKFVEVYAGLIPYLEKTFHAKFFRLETLRKNLLNHSFLCPIGTYMGKEIKLDIDTFMKGTYSNELKTSILSLKIANEKAIERNIIMEVRDYIKYINTSNRKDSVIKFIMHDGAFNSFRKIAKEELGEFEIESSYVEDIGNNTFKIVVGGYLSYLCNSSYIKITCINGKCNIKECVLKCYKEYIMNNFLHVPKEFQKHISEKYKIPILGEKTPFEDSKIQQIFSINCTETNTGHIERKFINMDNFINAVNYLRNRSNIFKLIRNDIDKLKASSVESKITASLDFNNFEKVNETEFEQLNTYGNATTAIYKEKNKEIYDNFIIIFSIIQSSFNTQERISVRLKPYSDQYDLYDVLDDLIKDKNLSNILKEKYKGQLGTYTTKNRWDFDFNSLNKLKSFLESLKDIRDMILTNYKNSLSNISDKKYPEIEKIYKIIANTRRNRIDFNAGESGESLYFRFKYGRIFNFRTDQLRGYVATSPAIFLSTIKKIIQNSNIEFNLETKPFKYTKSNFIKVIYVCSLSDENFLNDYYYFPEANIIIYREEDSY